VETVQSSKILVDGRARLPIKLSSFCGESRQIEWSFLMTNATDAPLVLGTDFLSYVKAVLSWDNAFQEFIMSSSVLDFETDSWGGEQLNQDQGPSEGPGLAGSDNPSSSDNCCGNAIPCHKCGMKTRCYMHTREFGEITDDGLIEVLPLILPIENACGCQKDEKVQAKTLEGASASSTTSSNKPEPILIPGTLWSSEPNFPRESVQPHSISEKFRIESEGPSSTASSNMSSQTSSTSNLRSQMDCFSDNDLLLSQTSLKELKCTNEQHLPLAMRKSEFSDEQIRGKLAHTCRPGTEDEVAMTFPELALSGEIRPIKPVFEIEENGKTEKLFVCIAFARDSSPREIAMNQSESLYGGMAYTIVRLESGLEMNGCVDGDSGINLITVQGLLSEKSLCGRQGQSAKSLPPTQPGAFRREKRKHGEDTNYSMWNLCGSDFEMSKPSRIGF